MGAARHSRRPHQRHCGTGIWPGRDIAAGWRDIETPCASLPTRSPSQPRTPARKAGVLDARKRMRARDGLSAGGKWIRTSGSARDCTTVEVGSRASPGQSSSPAARPRLERATNGGSLGSAPGRDPAASPERAHRIPAKRCFRTRCVSAARPPHPRKNPGAAAVFLPATSSAFSGKPNGAIRPPGRHSACPGPLTAAIPDRLSRPTIMLSGFAPGSRIVRHFGGDR